MSTEAIPPGVKAKRLIDGVEIKKLRLIPDDRGYLMEMLRSDDGIFQKFGQVYLSVGYPGVVKGWHYHKVQTDFFTIVSGMMKVVLYDGREGSSTHGEINEFFMGELNPILITIPPGVLHGMMAIGNKPGFLVNCPTEVYCYDEPDEFRVDPHDGTVPYEWEQKDG
ncbi:dTDP-4-dehydrorhamnose 3,5-epimerase family protein [bacterium]|nr:dTDP-4-dehydrorhamnose 3,5-epimerase family protein [bacterium]